MAPAKTAQDLIDIFSLDARDLETLRTGRNFHDLSYAEGEQLLRRCVEAYEERYGFEYYRLTKTELDILQLQDFISQASSKDIDDSSLVTSVKKEPEAIINRYQRPDTSVPKRQKLPIKVPKRRQDRPVINLQQNPTVPPSEPRPKATTKRDAGNPKLHATAGAKRKRSSDSKEQIPPSKKPAAAVPAIREEPKESPQKVVVHQPQLSRTQTPPTVQPQVNVMNFRVQGHNHLNPSQGHTMSRDIPQYHSRLEGQREAQMPSYRPVTPRLQEPTGPWNYMPAAYPWQHQAPHIQYVKESLAPSSTSELVSSNRLDRQPGPGPALGHHMYTSPMTTHNSLRNSPGGAMFLQPQVPQNIGARQFSPLVYGNRNGIGNVVSQTNGNGVTAMGTFYNNPAPQVPRRYPVVPPIPGATVTPSSNSPGHTRYYPRPVYTGPINTGPVYNPNSRMPQMPVGYPPELAPAYWLPPAIQRASPQNSARTSNQQKPNASYL
ncbi:hypothetical protein TWF718_010164 [Orbilia javanica]|uniref:Uncharacterized protein n=1 Tax=Orbilia javanica TaxID=47235 RepID=A0AAN8MLH8_9PEZI